MSATLTAPAPVQAILAANGTPEAEIPASPALTELPPATKTEAARRALKAGCKNTKECNEFTIHHWNIAVKVTDVANAKTSIKEKDTPRVRDTKAKPAPETNKAKPAKTKNSVPRPNPAESAYRSAPKGNPAASKKEPLRDVVRELCFHWGAKGLRNMIDAVEKEAAAVLR